MVPVTLSAAAKVEPAHLSPFSPKQPRWDVLRGSIHFVSVKLTIGAVALAAPLAWLLAPFATTIAWKGFCTNGDERIELPG